MSTEDGRAGGRGCIAAFCIAAALCLCFLGGQRILAHGLLAGEPERISMALRSGGRLPPELLEESIRRRERATQVLPGHGNIWLELARLEARRSPEGTFSTPPAQAALVQSLSTKPNDGFAWALYATARYESGAPQEEVAELLRYSHLLKPVDASAVQARLPVALGIWQSLSAEEMASTRSDLELMWSSRRLRSWLVRFYLKAGLAERAVIRDVLLADDRRRAAFDRAVLAAAGLDKG